MGVSVVRIDAWVLLAVGASLLAALSYAIGSTYVARHLADTPSAALAAGQQIGATLLLAAPVAATAAGTRPSAASLIAVSVLGLICTGAAFVAYFDLIHRVGPVSAVTVTLLAPVFGIAWAVALLGEQISLGLVVGVALVLVGVNLIVRPRPVKAGEALTPSSDERTRLTSE